MPVLILVHWMRGWEWAKYMTPRVFLLLKWDWVWNFLEYVVETRMNGEKLKILTLELRYIPKIVQF